MIHKICNIGHEDHIDVFQKTAIIKAKDLPPFTGLAYSEDIAVILNSISDNASVLLADLLPNNIQVSHSEKITPSGALYKVGISFVLTPQDKNLQQLMEQYNNEEIVLLLHKKYSTHLFGTTAQPLLFTYKAKYSSKHKDLKGYVISLSSAGQYEPEVIFEDIVFNIYSRGLAFQLAGQL